MSESASGAGIVATGMYWHLEVHDLARSAYVADLDADPAGPEFFVEWLRRALEAHSALAPVVRAGLIADLGEVATGRGLNQMYPLPQELLDQVALAIVEDREQLGKATSRSAFAREAVLVAVGQARRRRGGTLPPPPNQLPNRRPRRYP